MKTIDTWSYSRWSDFDSCPFKAWLKHAERVPDPSPRTAADRGTAIHTLAEKYILGEIDPLPLELSKFKDEFISLRNTKNRLMLEQEWGFDSTWQPCEYRGPDTWGRVKADCVMERSPTEGVVIDFKTGKRFGNELKHAEQVQVYALSAFILHPEWKEVTTELWYLDADELANSKITRNVAMDRYLKVWDTRFRKMTDSTEFPTKPNILSCKWCPYGDTGHCTERVVDQKATTNFFKRKYGGK